MIVAPDAYGWPDPSRPGVPLLPHRDGLHGLVLGWHEAKCLWWDAGEQRWLVGRRYHFDASRYRYLGMIITPAEVAANLPS